jgi:hypothetical protein
MSRRSQERRAARQSKAAKRWPQKRENPIGASDRVLKMGHEEEYGSCSGPQTSAARPTNIAIFSPD